ncbi:DUF433 domain-containing protein [Streptomyces sp. enrichment culture]|uniref:DUF433 domain-containing protein n=1 Tax=Streptomyces sp. enrichment culture TaxID=1795815 RepID=UPI003F552C68
MIDPRCGHGRPVVAANRVAVKAITDLRQTGENVEDIAYDFDMTPEQVDELCRAVVRLAARVLPRPQSRTSRRGRPEGVRLDRSPHRDEVHRLAFFLRRVVGHHRHGRPDPPTTRRRPTGSFRGAPPRRGRSPCP